jgi:ribA/ribD-fused uncharacterized protein
MTDDINLVPKILEGDSNSTKKWKSYAVWDKYQIKGFFGDYRFLSNFHPSPCYYKGILFPSSEHAYQFAKIPLPYFDIPLSYAFWENMAKPVIKMSAADVKKWGQSCPIRQDWEQVKYDVMLGCVFSKFYEHLELRRGLLETGSKYLEETNHWNDRFWGVDYYDSRGKNNLGKILMKVRSVLQ